MIKLLISALLCCVACAGAQPKPASQASQASKRALVPPPALLAPSVLSFDFQWRQHVTAHWPTGTQSFDAVLQKRAGELSLLGLSPMGLPGFVFRLNEARELQVENRTGQALPFEPAYVVADVQRVFCPWLATPQPGFTGERTGKHDQVVVRERFQQGRLQERQLTRDTPAGSEHIVIRYLEYPAAHSQHEAPLRATLENQLLGYTLSIETIEQTEL